MSRLVEAVVPARLGNGFRWLLASSWTSNLSDGLAIAAGPLLVASLSSDPFLIALAATVQWLPPLVFGLWAGVVSDRLDRRLVVIVVDLVRAGVLAVLTLAIATGEASIPVVLIALFCLGMAEVFADNASHALLPTLLHRDDLAIGNARVMFGFGTLNQLAGPPLGAALFVVGAAWPFAAQVLLVILGAALVSRIVLPKQERDRDVRHHIRRDIAEGFRWAYEHAAVRTLILTIFTFNITFGAAWSVLVLYATQRLGMGAVGFGLLTTVSAVGGIIGTMAYGRITRHVSLGDIMRIGLVIETFTHLALAITTVPWVAMVIFFVFGAHAFIWGTTSAAVRQRAVPSSLQGRVGAVNTVGVYGGLVIGSAIGGLLAQRWGVTAPFWFAFAGSAIFVVLIWGQLTHIAHTDEETPAEV